MHLLFIFLLNNSYINEDERVMKAFFFIGTIFFILAICMMITDMFNDGKNNK